MTPIVAEMPLKHVKQSGCTLAHHFLTLFLPSLHLVPAEGCFFCGIPTMGTWRDCGKQSRMGESPLLTWTTEGCTYLGKSFSRATMQHPVRLWTCPFLDFFYDSLGEISQKLQNLGDFANLLFFPLWLIFFFYLFVGGFFVCTLQAIALFKLLDRTLLHDTMSTSKILNG